MANHVSSLKRARQTERKTEVNRSNKSRVRGSLRALREALQKGDAKSVTEQYRATVSALDKSVQKGTLQEHRLTLQEPPERAREGRRYQEGVATLSAGNTAGRSIHSGLLSLCGTLGRRRRRWRKIVHLDLPMIQHC
jgi:small subunit ribosomal protein S20